MHVARIYLILAVCVGMFAGCNPGVTVRKNPSACDTGIRYYRPKPYLILKPTGRSETTGTGAKAKTIREPSDEFVEISMDYLPDFSEEYSLKVRPGLGSATVNIGLEDGWNLTSINQTLESKFAENVGAIAELAKGAASFVTTSEDSGSPSSAPDTRTQKWVVRATNVPLGYYEAVINEDINCKKRLWGWRYVGFAPFNCCPTDIQGAQGAGCNDFGGAVYGLAFENGVMVFKELNDLRGPAETKRDAVDTGLMTFTKETPADKNAKEGAFKKKVIDQVKKEIGVVIVDADVGLDFATAKKLAVKIKLTKTDYTKLTATVGAEKKLEQQLDTALLGDARKDFPKKNLTTVAFDVVSS